MCEILTVSERRACRVLGQVRRTQRYTSILSDEDTVLVANVVSLATEYGCGLTTAPASAYDPSIATMCGPMTLSSTGRVMVGS